MQPTHKKNVDADPSAKTRTLRYTTMLFCILVTICYALYYQSKSQTTGQTPPAKSTPELAESLKSDPGSLTNEEFVAAALAWEEERKRIQEERAASRRKIGPREDPVLAYHKFVSQLQDNAKAIGDAQPMLRQPILDELNSVQSDRPPQSRF